MRLRELGDIFQSDLVRSCGYMSAKKDGDVRQKPATFPANLFSPNGWTWHRRKRPNEAILFLPHKFLIMATLQQHKEAFAKLQRRRWREVGLNRAIEISIVAVSVFFFVIALHQITGAYYFLSVDDRIARLDELSKVATTLSALFIAATFLFTAQKYREEATLKRKLEGNEFLVSIILGRVTDYRMRLRNKVDPYGTSNRGAVSYERSVSAGLLRPHGRDEILIKSFLNHLEYMCLAIHEGIIDEGFVKDSQENVLFLYWKWFYPYIADMRKSYYKDAWMGIDYMVFRWRAKEAEDVVREHASS